MSSPGNVLYQYMLLLWKSWLLRRRHYIVTALEIIFPILLSSITLMIYFETGMYASDEHSKFDRKTGVQYKNATFYKPFNPLNKTDDYREAYIFYTPDNNVSKNVIDSAVMKLWPNMKERKINVDGLKSEKDIENAVLKLQFGDTLNYGYVILGIVFENFDKSDSHLPASLDYKLRYLDYTQRNFHTTSKYSFYGIGPQNYDDAYVRSLFLGVQYAIDMSFINEVNNSKNLGVKDVKVDLQRFPYPPYKYGEDNLTIIQLVSMLIVYGFIIFAIVLVKRVVDEKVNGSKELMRMMGMSDWIYWSSTFINYFILVFIIYLITAILYKIPFRGSTSCLENTDFFLFLVLLLLYGASAILFCLAVTTFINRAVFAIVLIIILWSVTHDLVFAFYFPFSETDAFFQLSQGAKLGLCLLPNAGIKFAFQIVSKMIKDGKGALWSNMTEFVLSPDINLAMVMAMMLISCIIYSIIIWYVDAVWPWKLGVPKPFYFPFTKEYWCGSMPKEFEDQDNLSLQSMEYFEDDPVNCTPGVVISHLSKEFTTGFRTKIAVNDVSLKIYNGQITALLGHNGAGKTTTINVLTGMYPPTSGTASINGYDILSSTKKARTSLGLCPQHNVLYDSLTVEEHLMLYAGLKGVMWSQLQAEAWNIIKLLNLELKHKELAKTLSGGMKRKLSLGIAVVGGSKVLFLDEPTSGLDVEARRSVWDMLLSIRNDRTIVLTTHYMEEADVLGDRIAIMADGEIQCCGSPFFLKMKFGTGYHLHVAIEPTCDMNRLTTLLQKHIPETELKTVLGKEATFALSGSTSASFGNMFQELEDNKGKLGVGSFGISVTTMEDVFLNVGSIVDQKLKLLKTSDKQEISSYHSNTSNELIQKSRLQGLPKFLQQVKGLFIKRAEYAKRHWSIFAAQLIIPLLIMCLFCWLVFDVANLNDDTEQPLSLNLKSIFGDSSGFYHFTEQQEAEAFASGYLKKTLIESGVSVQKVNDSNAFLINIGEKSLQEFLKKYFVGGGAEYLSNGTLYLKAWYNGEPYHVSALSLNVMNTAVLKYLTNSNNAVIRITNAPFPQKYSYMRNNFDSVSERTMTSIFIPLSLIFLSASFVLVPVHETITKSKLLQLMTGISGITYWLMMYAWDVLVHILCCALLLIPFAIFDTSGVVVGHSEAYGSFFLLFLLYGLCSIPLCYLVSFIVKKPSTGFALLIAFNFITGLVISVIMVSIGFNVFAEESKKVAIALWFLRLLPSFAVTWGSINLMGVAIGNTVCDKIPSNVKEYMCPTLNKNDKLFPCCQDICADKCFKKIHPITWEQFGCGREIFFLLLDTVIFFAIIFILESSIRQHLSKLFNWLLSSLSIKKKTVFVQPTTSFLSDSDVCNESQRVENIFHQGRAGEEALLTLRLTKWYHSVCAVDHLTFAVHNEECFGLLGVNGAGKTTTFKMLTGDISPTEGTAVIQNSTLYENLKMFQSYLGYCPQYDALLDRLTGRELLTLFSRLRCLPEKDVQSSVEQMIEMVDLQEHADKQTRFYSGGNKRKLSLAIALIGAPPVILLDEPTSGVDPVARRKIWNSLSEAKIKTGAAIVLTTHSMEECEALCSRLAIMVNGQFRCIGPIQQLKSKFGQGYTLIVKLQQQHFLDPNAVDTIKSRIENDFPSASLKDDHQGMLQYHVSDASIPWSHLFNIMEQVKNIYQLEDYLISDTSLEQIFLTFARGQRISGDNFT